MTAKLDPRAVFVYYLKSRGDDGFLLVVVLYLLSNEEQ